MATRKRSNSENRGKNAAGVAKAELRRSQVFDMRLKGMSYREIADAIGVSLSMAHKYYSQIMTEMREATLEKAEDLRELERARLEKLLVNIVNSEGFAEGDPQVASAYIRLSESLRKLMGLDQPAKVDVTTDGEPIKYYGPGMEGV